MGGSYSKYKNRGSAAHRRGGWMPYICPPSPENQPRSTETSLRHAPLWQTLLWNRLCTQWEPPHAAKAVAELTHDYFTLVLAAINTWKLRCFSAGPSGAVWVLGKDMVCEVIRLLWEAQESFSGKKYLPSLSVNVYFYVHTLSGDLGVLVYPYVR